MFLLRLVTTLFLLFQQSQVNGQAFTASILPVPVLPNGPAACSIAYDEASHFFYLGGNTRTSLDGEPYGGQADIFVTKHFMNGTRIWSRLTGGTNNDYGIKLIRIPETGHLFIFGTAFSASIDGQTTNSVPDTVLVKYAQNGTKIFTSFFGRSGSCISGDALVDVQNQQFVFGGMFNNFIAFTINSMNNGSLLRQDTLAVQGQYYGLTPIPGSDSDCYAAGRIYGVLDGQPYSAGADILLVKLNYLNFTRYWTRTWGNVTDETAYDVQYDPNNLQVYVGGFAYGITPLNDLPELGDYDAILICVSDNGTYHWTRRFGTSTTDVIYSLGIHPSTGTLFAVGVYSYSYGLISTFGLNGTMLQLSVSAPGAYRDISFSSNATAAFICDFNGNGVFVTLNISGPPLLAVSKATVSTLMNSPTLNPGSTMSTSIAPLLIPAASTIPLLTGILTASALPSESQSASQSSSYESTATFTAAIVGPVENVPSSPVAVLFKSLNMIVGIIAVAVVVLLVVLIFLCICLKMRSKQRHAAQIPTSLRGIADMTTEFSQITATETDQQTSSTTILRSDFELSLPGFLMFESRSSFRIKRQIAKGGGGVVSIADVFTLGLSDYGSTIIVKTLGSDFGTPLSKLSEREQKSFKQEVAIMHYFREQKHVAKLLGWTSDPACILMKFYPHGSADKWIHGDAYKSKVFQIRFMNDIARGVLAMHTAGFVHCDLKPQNVLVDEDEQGWLYCCLTDFAITQVVDEISLLVKDFAVSNIRGLSIEYAAPEAFQRFRQKSPPKGVAAELVMKVDLYSLAVIMLELLERRRPWGE